MHRLAVALLVFAGFSSPALATEPCMPMEEAAFREQVLKPADLIIEGSIVDFSTAEPRWTKIKGIRELRGKMPEGEITIRGWQAYEEPLFTYKKGDHVVLLLKQDGDGYKLTNDSWQYCVPSIMTARSETVVAIGGTAASKKYPLRYMAFDDLGEYFDSLK